MTFKPCFICCWIWTKNNVMLFDINIYNNSLALSRVYINFDLLKKILVIPVYYTVIHQCYYYTKSKLFL